MMHSLRGRAKKIIQAPSNNINSTENPDDEQRINDQPPEISSITHPKPQSSNSIAFPSLQETQTKAHTESQEKDQPVNNQYGHGKRDCLPQGSYRTMHEGLVAAVTTIVDLDQVVLPEEFHDDPDCYIDCFQDLPPDLVLASYSGVDPKMLDEALRGPNAKEWQEALEYEISQLEKLKTWVVEDLPQGYTAILCSEVIKVKHGPDGEIKSYRVRIVAGGHRQVEEINYTETFLAAAKMPTVHTVLANAAHQEWGIEHIDVKSVYLNAPLKEEIYMKPPHSILKSGQEGKVLRLLKGLYGLKQAGRGWYLEMLKVLMRDMGFKRSCIDHSVFYKKEGHEHIIIAVATDNMVVTSRRKSDAMKFKSNVKQHWEITDHGPIQWFLGFEIKRNRESRTISINQRAYIESMVEKFRLTSAKPVLTPMELNAQFTTQQSPSTPNQTTRMQGVPYSEAIGSILWLAVISHPDVAYVVGILSQFIQNPRTVHWEGVKRVINYLGMTRELWLTFGENKKNLLEGYCDADWESQAHRHSISGFAFHYGIRAISWLSKKQNIVALSSTESEYIALTHAAKEAIWLQTFVNEVTGISIKPLTILGDNQGLLVLTRDNKYYSRTKHIDLQYYFICEAVDDAKIKVGYVPTKDNIADIFTKSLAKPKFTRFVAMLGLGRLNE